MSLRKLANGNNYYRWPPERLAELARLLSQGVGPTVIASELGCHDVQCVFYGMRKLAKLERARLAV